MQRHFTVRFDNAQLDEIWSFADEIERATGLVIYWHITSYFPGLLWLNGEIL